MARQRSNRLVPGFSSIESLEPRQLFSAAAPVAPSIDAAGVVHVGGTNKSDVIRIAVDTVAAKVNVTLNGTLTAFDLASVTGVAASGGNGNDDIRVVETTPGEFTLPVTLSGGNGKDSLVGGSGNDSLDGGNGKDHLDAGAGDDSLNGGNGKDDMIGGLGADHFVGRDGHAEVDDESADDVFDASGHHGKPGK